MKKIIFSTLIALIAIIILGFSGYILQSNLIKNAPRKILIPNLGKVKSEVFKNLKLEVDKDIELNKQGLGLYDYKKKQKFGGEYFTQSLLFAVSDNTLYGLRYLNIYKENAEVGYKEAIRLNKELNKQFGKPTKYTAESQSIEKIPSFNDLVNSQKTQSYLRIWKVTDEVMATLRLTYNMENGIEVYVQYSLIPAFLKNNSRIPMFK